MSEKFYTTQRLVGKYCRGGCDHRDECVPTITDNQSGDMSGLNLLVVCNIAAGECPIMARKYPFAGWVHAKNHKGRCGEQER